MSVERERERLRVRWGLVPAGALRRWLRLAAYAEGHVPGRYEEVLRDGWSEEWPLVLLRGSDGVTLLLDGVADIAAPGNGCRAAEQHSDNGGSDHIVDRALGAA